MIRVYMDTLVVVCCAIAVGLTLFDRPTGWIIALALAINKLIDEQYP